MAVRALLMSVCFAIVAVAAGCPRVVGKVGCENPRDCVAGQICQDGQCVTGTAACTLDSQCDLTLGQICNVQTGQCEQGNVAGCNNTAECPITQFCNTSTHLCADLADGFCRNNSQCVTATPVCSAASENVPGRCVECLTSTDCGGAQCVNPGVCSDINCPPNSTPINGTCHCNPGFHDDGAGGCPANSTGEGEGEGAGGEGEGEGAGPACDPNLAGLDCILSGGPYNNCSASNQCECNAFQLFFSCALNNQDPDQSTCGCVPTAGEGEGEGGAGEGEGEGEGGGPGAPGANQSCVTAGATVTCQSGLTCMFVSDANNVPTAGVCKAPCASDGECSGTKTCLLGLFADGSGFCANERIPGLPGQSCQGDLYSPAHTWFTTDQVCTLPGDPQGAEDRCIGGTCTEVCKLASDPTTTLTCFFGTCQSTIHDIGIEEQGAICQ